MSGSLIRAVKRAPIEDQTPKRSTAVAVGEHFQRRIVIVVHVHPENRACPSIPGVLRGSISKRYCCAIRALHLLGSAFDLAQFLAVNG